MSNDHDDEGGMQHALATYRIGEVEHSFQQIVQLDWGGDQEAATDHFLSTIYRRTYAYIERGH